MIFAVKFSDQPTDPTSLLINYVIGNLYILEAY